MVDERIEVLKNILLDLHHGAKAEAVQEEFAKGLNPSSTKISSTSGCLSITSATGIDTSMILSIPHLILIFLSL